MDVLSDVLQAVRLNGAVFFDVHAGRDMAAASPAMSQIADWVMPGAEHVISFHIMLEGGCWAELTEHDNEPVRLESGDMIMFPRGDPHIFCTTPGRRRPPNMDMYKQPRNAPLPLMMNEAEGEPVEVRFVCGYLGCDARPFNPLLDALPRIIRFNPQTDGSRLEMDLVRVAVDESGERRAGGESILARLSELLFVRAVRRYIEDMPAGADNWLSALRDRHVSAALHLIHGRPAEDWTLDSLAREAGLSRTVFSERFTQYTGLSPIRYLTGWRMQLATRLLERPEVSVARAAAEVGYHSEAAFHRAFKKYTGTPPGEWRRARG